MVRVTGRAGNSTAVRDCVLSDCHVSPVVFVVDWTVSPVGSLDAEGFGDHSHSDSVCHVIHGVTGCLTGVEDGGISDRCGKAYPLAAFSDE